MSGPRLRRALSERAVVDAAATRVHPAKAAERAQAAAAPPSPRAPTPSRAAPRVRVRPLVAHAALARRLETLGLALDPEGLAGVLMEVEKALGGRSLRTLGAAARAALVARTRHALVAAVPGVRRRQRELAEAARGLRGATAGRELHVATADVAGGVWVFVHTDAARDAVVLGEAFVTARPGVAVPARPDPARAGLAGRVRWRDGDAVGEARPRLVPGTPQAAGVAAGALDDGAEAVLTEFGRAQEVALAGAAATRRPVRTTGALSPVEARTEGGGITAIEVRGPESGGPPPGRRAWDLWYTISGRTRPEIARRAEREMDALLPPAGELGDPRYRGWARAHAWGPVLGDETFAGLAYAPHEAVNLLQLATTEGFARWGATRSGLNLRSGTALRVDVKVRLREVGGRPRPFLRSAEYTVTLEDGTQVIATLEVDELGRVEKSVRSGG